MRSGLGEIFLIDSHDLDNLILLFLSESLLIAVNPTNAEDLIVVILVR